MHIKPLHDWIVINPSEANERTAGGLYIPESAKSKPHEGEVVAIGAGRWKEEDDDKKGSKKGSKKGEKKPKTFLPTTLKPGQKIAYDQWSGHKVELDGKEFVMVREEDVLGTFE